MTRRCCCSTRRSRTFSFSDQQRGSAGVGWRLSVSAFGELKKAEAVEEPRAALEGAQETLRYQEMVVDDEVAKISVVGIGMRSHSGVAQRMFSALAAENINIKVITTSEIKVSVLIDRKYMELAVQALHNAFGLDAT